MVDRQENLRLHRQPRFRRRQTDGRLHPRCRQRSQRLVAAKPLFRVSRLECACGRPARSWQIGGNRASPPIADLAEWICAFPGCGRSARMRRWSVTAWGRLLHWKPRPAIRNGYKKMAMIGSAVPIQVSEAFAEQHRRRTIMLAYEMINAFAHSNAAQIGGNRVPGMWMMGSAMRLMERSGDGVLHADFSACNDYAAGLAAAQKLQMPRADDPRQTRPDDADESRRGCDLETAGRQSRCPGRSRAFADGGKARRRSGQPDFISCLRTQHGQPVSDHPAPLREIAVFGKGPPRLRPEEHTVDLGADSADHAAPGPDADDRRLPAHADPADRRGHLLRHPDHHPRTGATLSPADPVSGRECRACPGASACGPIAPSFRIP